MQVYRQLDLELLCKPYLAQRTFYRFRCPQSLLFISALVRDFLSVIVLIFNLTRSFTSLVVYLSLMTTLSIILFYSVNPNISMPSFSLFPQTPKRYFASV
jgi:hypothetical protein